MRRGAFVVVAAALGVGTVSLLPSTPRAERAPSDPGPTYVGRHKCGVIEYGRLAPITTLQVDLDGDGEAEQLVANYGGIELHRVQPGSRPPVTVRQATLFSSSAAPRNACVDLRAVDVDGDGDLDLIFASPTELVVLTNSRGRFTVSRREAQRFEASADVRIQVAGRDITVQPM